MSTKIKLRKVQAQRKFAQGAYIPPHTNNTIIDRRGIGHDKPAAPPTLVHNMSAMSLLDQISFQSIHVHEKKLQPVVRLERLASPQRISTPPRVTTPRLSAPQRMAPPQKLSLQQRLARPVSSSSRSESLMSTPLAFRSMMRAHPKNSIPESSALSRKARLRKRTRERPLGLRQQPAIRPLSPAFTTASSKSSMPLAWMTYIGCKRRYKSGVPTVSLARCKNLDAFPKDGIVRVPTTLTKQLKRYESTAQPQPRTRTNSPVVSAPATPLSFLARNRGKDSSRVLTNGISKSGVGAKKKLKKLGRKLRASQRLRGQSKAARSAKDDTDTEDDTPLTLLAKSKTKTGQESSPSHPTPGTSRSRPANEKPVSPPVLAAKSSENKSDKKEGYYCADNIVRWLSNNDTVCPSPVNSIGASSSLFKVPLPPKDRRKRIDPTVPTPADDEAKSLSSLGTISANSAVQQNLSDISTTKLYENEDRESVQLDEDEQSVAGVERPPSTCPSERYVTVRDVVSAPTKERELRCRNCKYCSRADKVEKLSKVVETSTNTQDVYEFDAERDGEEESRSQLLREFRSRHTRPGQLGFSDTVYLDIGPSNSEHMILITTVTINNKRVMQAQIIKKKNAKNITEYNLIENETLFDQLIKTMDGLIPSLQKRNDFNKPPSPPPSEITEVNYQTAVADEVAAADDEEIGKDESQAEPSKTKSQSNNRKRIKSLPKRTASSKTTKASTSKRAMRSSKVTKTPTRSAKSKTEKSRSRKTPSSKIPAKRTTRNTNKSASGSEPQRAASPVAGPSRATDANHASSPSPSDHLALLSPDPKKPTAVVREAPVYYPTEAEFSDPIAFFEKIMPTASKFGICKVVAPASFKPKFSIYENITFNVANQYISRMYIRWGQASKEMCAIKAHLASQRVAFTRAPVMDNLEVDLPRLYRTVQRLGGLKKVIEKKRWGRVAEEMHFLKTPKLDKKVDDVYVRFLLPYDTLSSQERESIKVAVNKAWHKKNERIVERAADPLHRQKQLLGECQSSSDTDEEPEEIVCALTEAEDCIVTGRRMTLNNYARVAKAIQETYFPNTPQPTPQEVEDVYWRMVLLAAEHVCVNTAAIDTGDDGFGFSKNRNDPFGRHPWNLKMISQNPGNVLHMLGRVVGVTVPTLHFGMVFSTSCWHRDPHGLPWIEYMHSGPAKIWYGIPDEQSSAFRKAVATLCPTACQNKSIWLPSDITMIPPNFLLSSDVSLTRVEQKPNEYIIVFPKAYSSSISTGHTTSESVYFATNSWLKTVDQVFQELRDSCEPTMFALEQLLIAVASDARAPPSLLQMVHTTLASIVADEKQHRLDLTRLGVTATTATRPPHKKKPNGAWNVRKQDECEVCRSTLYLSKVTGLPEGDSAVCLNHALLLLKSKKKPQRDVTELTLVVYLTEEQLDEVMSNLQNGFVPIR